MLVSSILAKVSYGVCCVAAATTLVGSYVVHGYVAAVGSIGTSHAITSGPSIGEQNILVMGLESRTNYNGQVLPADLLAAMHAGSVNGVLHQNVGGQDTNTLILIHIFPGGKKAVGYSIPRDDWVTFPTPYDGQSVGKIDMAYGLAWAQKLSELANANMGRDQRYFLANEAGQAAAIHTVEALTGVHIDHFAEVNLAGFYELARSFGGIEVCVRKATSDHNSGARLRKGYQHLWAAQALAFVRQRDNLTNGDLDRTHRQQAVIDYVMWKLKHQNVLSDLGQIQSLLGVAKQFVITDANWNLLDFASQMRALTGKNLTFKTAPIVGFHTFYLGGQPQDANLIDPVAIRAQVRRSFYPPATAASGTKHGKKGTTKAVNAKPSASTVDVLNGGNVPGLADRVSQALVAAGYKAGQVANATTQPSVTQVLYGKGTANAANAAKIAAAFGVTAKASGTLQAGHVQVLLGTDAINVPSFTGSSTAQGSSSGSSSGSTSSSGGASDNGAAGGVVTVKDNAPYGIPCVY